MAYFTSLWKARIIEKYRQEYENEKINSLLTSKTEIPQKTLMQRWRFYGHTTKMRMTGRLKQWFPDGSSVSNLYFYLKSDHAFPNFVLKSLFGFIGGVILTYLCFIFFVYQLSISLLHATVMSSVIGVLLTVGLAFSCRMRCLVFLLIPQMFSRVGRYTLTCYALVLILTGPATNTLRNSEVLTESMACSQEQIKTNSEHITETMKKPFNAMKESIKLMVDGMKRATSEMDRIISKISVMASCFGDIIQSSFSWLNSVADICTKKFGTPYDRCLKMVNKGMENCRKALGKDLAWLCNDSAAKSTCLTVQTFDGICIVPDYATASFAATLKRRLKNLKRRINSTFFFDVRIHHIYTYSSNDSNTPSQVTAGIVTEIRKRADPLLTWLSWSSCITSLFLLLIIFRAKYYQHMFETRSRFDNRYVTKELRELDFKRYKEKRETILPLNRRERTKYISISSFNLVLSEKVYITRSMVFMAITTFKLLIHMVADYSLYWVLTTMRYHGSQQTPLTRPSDAGVQVSGVGIVRDFISSILYSISSPLLSQKSTTVNCLPNPYPPDLQRYMQIGILIVLLWFFALFEPYGLRFRHVIMGHYQPDRAKTRAVWLYNHILKTRGSFMKLARRKLHREYKYTNHENLTFHHWLDSITPCWCLKYIFDTLPKEPHCLLCNTFEELNESDTKLTNCDTLKCPGVYCVRCFTDIGRLCTICLSPKDYGDMSDVSLEKGSSDESDDSDENTDIKQMKLKGTEKERLIRKSKSRKTNWKMLCDKNTNENNGNNSLVPFDGNYENLDDIDKITEDAEPNIHPDIDFNIEPGDMKDNTEIENNKNVPENLMNEETDKKSLIHLPENNISCSNKSKEQILVKKQGLIRNRRHGRLNRNRKFHIHVVYHFLGNLTLRCLKLSRTSFLMSSFYNIKIKSNLIKIRKVTYVIRSAVHLKRGRKIKRIKLKRRSRKRINKKTNYNNNKKESNDDKCKVNEDITNSKNLREKYSESFNKDGSKSKKHKYTFTNSYKGIKKLLVYFKILKIACDSRKCHKIRKNRTEVNEKVNLGNPLRKKTNVVNDGNDKNTKDNSYLKNNKYLLHTNLNFNFHRSSKESLEHKATSDSVMFPSNKENKNKMDNEKTVQSITETRSFIPDDIIRGKSSRRIEMVMSKVTCIDSKNKEDLAALDINESCKVIQDASTINSDTSSDKTVKKSKTDIKKSKHFKGEDTASSICNKSNISDKATFWNVSSLKSDWWSPIPDRKT